MVLTAGIGLQVQHLGDALNVQADGMWFEVDATDYMIDGGPRVAGLKQLSERFGISLHGAGLSLASADPPCQRQLARLCKLVDLVSPIAISDHLSWQRLGEVYHAGDLPFPRTRDALQVVAANVSRVQDMLGRPIMIENPAHYADFAGHDFTEFDFMVEVARITGCGLLVDINNIHVSAANLGYSEEAAIDAIPAELIGEIHLAGHSRDRPGQGLLIDSHDTLISDRVWLLFCGLIKRVGARPTIVEREGGLPAFSEVLTERMLANVLIRQLEDV